MKRTLLIIVVLILCLSLFGQPRVLADSSTWKSVPGPTGGSVSALALSPNYAADLTVFAGLRGQGVYRSLNGGNAWQPLGLSDQVIVDLAISSNFVTDHTLFAATGLGTSGYQVYRSADGGTTWQPPYVTPYSDGFKSLIGLSISPNYGNDHTIYALGTTEMYKSTDGGQVFTKMGGWYATHHITALVFSPAFTADHTLFAAVAGSGILKSIDSGGNWLPTAFSDSSFTALAISPDYSNDHTVAAIAGDTGQLYISTDGGTNRNGRDLHLSLGDKHTLLFSPTFATDRLMLAASSADPGAYRSSNGGDTWTPVGWYNPAQPDADGFVGGSIWALLIPPDAIENSLVLAGTSSGLYLSRYRGQDWRQNNAGLPQLTLRTFASAPNDPNWLLVGTSYFDGQHSNTTTPIEAAGNLQFSQDGGQSWHAVSGRIDRVRRVVYSPDAAIDHTAFACAGFVGQDGYTGGGLYRSIDDARHWSALIEHVACNDLALSPNYTIDHTAWAYVQGQGLLRTTNSGDAWNPLNNDFVAEMLQPSPNYAADQTLFASTSDARLLKSIDGGSHWTPVLSYTVTALAISPAYGASQTLYAGVKETSGSSGALYRSGDGGAHWQKLITSIPANSNNQPATISAIEFAKDGSIVVGVMYGGASSQVYRSIDGGQTWQAWGDLTDSGLFDLISLTNADESDRRGAFTFLAGTAQAIHWRDQQQRDPVEPGAWETTGPRGGRADLLAVSPNFVNDGFVFTGEVNTLRDIQYGPGMFKSGDWGQTWRSVGLSIEEATISPSNGAVYGYTFSPNFTSDRTLFASTSGGLFKSTDGGDTWHVVAGVSVGMPGGVVALALSPDYLTSGHMIATGLYGLMRMSQDFGQTWSSLPLTSAGTIAYSPNFAADGTLFASSYNVYRSINRSLSWTQVLTAAGSVALSPQFGVDHVAFVAGSDGVSKTINSGVTWTTVFSNSLRVFVSPRYGSDQTVYGLSGYGYNPNIGNLIYRSPNGGATWVTTSVGISTTTFGGLIFSPAFNVDHLMYATGSDGLYRSNDGGLNWSAVSYFAHQSVSAMVFSPGWPAHPYLLVGTSRAVYRSIDGGTTWARMQGIRTLGATPLAVSNDNSLWLAGTGNGVHASTKRGQVWSPFGTLSSAINELALSPAYATDHTLFVTTSCAGCAGVSIRRTTDGGDTWQIVRSMNFNGALAISPQYASDHTIYAIGGGSVARSINRGDSWESIGTWPPFATPYGQIALAPNYPSDSTIFAAGPGFWRLPPGETLWQAAASGILSTTDISAIAVAPNYTTSHTILAASVEYPLEGLRSIVFQSEDGGVNWQRSDFGLPNAEWRSIAFSPNYSDDHTVYLVSTQRLYRSTDDGHSWIAVAAPPDDVMLNRVALGRAGEVIVSSDAGVWQYRTGFRDLLIDGEAEAMSGWALNGADYATELNYHAQHALRLGLAQGSNRPIDSFATQTVTIPISATLAQLNLRLYPATSETNHAPQNQPATSGDAQYVSITPSGAPSGTGAISTTLLWMLSNDQAWQRYSFDLAPYAGQTIKVRVGVLNDGLGGQTALYVDSASLIILGANGRQVFLPIITKNN